MHSVDTVISDTNDREQELDRLMRSGKFLDAIVLSISTDRPKKTYALLEKLFEKESGNAQFETVLNRLSYEELTLLFQFAIDWNTNSRFSTVAQKVLHGMLKVLDPNFINISYEKVISAVIDMINSIQSVHAIITYSERHFKRVSSLLQNSYLLDYMLSNMRTAHEEQNNDLKLTIKENDGEEQEPAKKKKRIE